MGQMPFPLQLLVVTLAGWINREQQQRIEYLQTENRVLKEQLGKKRLRLTDDQRRRLAVKGKALGRRLLAQVATIVTPDTILRWHRQLVAAKWDYSAKRKKPGRTRVKEAIAELVVKLAVENPSWGYTRIMGMLDNLGHVVSRTTVANILREHGIEPSPHRDMRWRDFLRAHWQQLAAADFFTVEVWTKGGLVTYYVLFFIELATRRVHVAGITPSPNDSWMGNMAREVTAFDDGFLRGKTHLIVDRDPKFGGKFAGILRSEGIELLKLPPRSPNLNAFAERFVRSIKEECLSTMIFLGENSLRNAIKNFVEHYHAERNHQGLENKLIAPGEEVASAAGEVVCDERLGGILKNYRRAA